MLRFIVKRIGYMILTLFIVITMTFFLIHSIPGDPLAHLAKKLPEQVKLNYYAKYGLDRPVIEQYGMFMKNLVQGDLGTSLVYPGRSVTKIIKEYAPVSGRIGIQSIVIGFSLGIVLGIVAALKRNKWPDYVVMFLAIIGISVPSFVLANLLQYIFTVKFTILPTTGWGSFEYTILPTIAMSFTSLATYARYMRANCLDVIGQDYILTAQSKGVSKINLVTKHVIRNAILPVITLLGPQIAMIFVGSFVIESIFSIPGLGRYFVSSVQDRDFSMVLGQTVFMASLYIVALVAVDIIYSLVDPRIRINGGKR
ncbi:oligopeptide transport system permease protein [Clostridium collagenovorans DSM 3089]|uniref:Oligopeptide transport system permease protein n=1 Tax=Clostridium collagenovorans DSM 3089 TaxID=1121306 RepID=A0A1M5VSP2_9CLOT|nr:ABC transporter permease [Clostridium collagenovorans]SHH78276.1 oligopeptide transport system permease protein [Clostridium collagenovorans DSM 3089]